MTLREYISRVRSTHKLLSGDGTITDRVIAAELKSKAVYLLRQQTNKRKLWNTDTIFTPIPCLELEEVPLASCCEYRGTKTVARSIHPIPRILEGDYQYLIQGIYSIEKNIELKYVTIRRYLNLLKLPLPESNVYYWLHDGHLYVSQPEVRLVELIAAFEEDVPTELLNPDCDCSPQDKVDCTNPLDREFKFPGFIGDGVVKMVSETLLQSYFRLPVDHTSDNKDDVVNPR